MQETQRNTQRARTPPPRRWPRPRPTRPRSRRRRSRRSPRRARRPGRPRSRRSPRRRWTSREPRVGTPSRGAPVERARARSGTRCRRSFGVVRAEPDAAAPRRRRRLDAAPSPNLARSLVRRLWGAHRRLKRFGRAEPKSTRRGRAGGANGSGRRRQWPGAESPISLPAATTTTFDSTTYDPLGDDDAKDPDAVFGDKRGRRAGMRGTVAAPPRGATRIYSGGRRNGRRSDGL